MSDDPKPGSKKSARGTIGFTIGAVIVLCLLVRECKPDHPAPAAAQAVPSSTSGLVLPLGTPAVQLQTASQPYAVERPQTESVLCGTLKKIRGFIIPKDAACRKEDLPPAQPDGTTALSTVPEPGLTDLTAPAVSDPNSPDNDTNWSPWIQGHQGYTLYTSPDFAKPTFNAECWDITLNKPRIITPGNPCLASAYRFQSKTSAAISMQYGFYKNPTG